MSVPAAAPASVEAIVQPVLASKAAAAMRPDAPPMAAPVTSRLSRGMSQPASNSAESPPMTTLRVMLLSFPAWGARTAGAPGIAVSPRVRSGLGRVEPAGGRQGKYLG